MHAIKAATLPAPFALAKSMFCLVEILLTVVSTAVLMSYTICKIRTTSETVNNSAAGIKKNANFFKLHPKGIVPKKLYSRVLIYDASIETIVDLLKKMTKYKFKKIYSITLTLKDLKYVVKKLKKMFTIIKAGGGVVNNNTFCDGLNNNDCSTRSAAVSPESEYGQSMISSCIGNTPCQYFTSYSALMQKFLYYIVLF